MVSSCGAVLGIDVGYSRTRRTTGLCWLVWDGEEIVWRCGVAGHRRSDRIAVLEALRPPEVTRVSAVAIDGPLRPGLHVEKGHRACESALSRGAFARRGKPGSTASGSGADLHRAATARAALATDALDLAASERPESLAGRALFEAFPNLFLGVLCDEAAYPARPIRKRQWTDTLFPLVGSRLRALVAELLPGRRLAGETPTGHDETAAFVCGVTALCAARGHYAAIGSPHDGWILLPPRWHWGRAAEGDATWPERELERVLPCVRKSFPEVALRSGPRSRA